MNAKEMFEKLGYKCKETIFAIEYEKDEENYFVFFKVEKRITIGGYDITLKELKAINQQCKELRWLDE